MSLSFMCSAAQLDYVNSGQVRFMYSKQTMNSLLRLHIKTVIVNWCPYVYVGVVGYWSSLGSFIFDQPWLNTCLKMHCVLLFDA